ncbi:hypothetical protein Tco_0492656 [Tanacetum coccineum]
MEGALAIQDSINPFQKICVWKKAVAFLVSLPAPLLHAEWVPKGSGDFVKEVGDGKWHIKIRVPNPYGNTFEQGYETRSTNRKKSNFYRLCQKIKEMLEIKVYEMGGQEEVFSLKLGDALMTDNELITKKVIKFRLGGRGGLRSDEDFNAKDNWLSISSEENLHLSRSLALTIRSPILKVLQKMITYGVGCPDLRRTFDATNLIDHIDSNGKFNCLSTQAPRSTTVANAQTARPSIQDLYDRMGNMEIRQGVIKRIGAYAPPGYNKEQQED